MDVDQFERIANNLGAWVAVMAVLIFTGVTFAYSLRPIFKWFLGRIATACEVFFANLIGKLDELLRDHDAHDARLTDVHSDVRTIKDGVHRIEGHITRAIDGEEH